MGETISMTQLIVLVSITGLVVTIFGGVIIKLLNGNFDDLKRGQKELREFLDVHMVGREVCNIKHSALDAKDAEQEKKIERLFRLLSPRALHQAIDEDERHDVDR